VSTLLLILFSIVPRDALPRDGVERLERNNFYDPEGRLVFTQLVGWSDNGRCRFWRMAKDGALPVERDHLRGDYVVIWNDSGVIREVRARSYEESWTQVDVETADREYLPAEKRQPLRSK